MSTSEKIDALYLAALGRKPGKAELTKLQAQATAPGTLQAAGAITTTHDTTAQVGGDGTWSQNHQRRPDVHLHAAG
jgi:hypothetical protein